MTSYFASRFMSIDMNYKDGHIYFRRNRFVTDDPDRVAFLESHQDFGKVFWRCTVDGIRLDIKGSQVYSDEMIMLPMSDGRILPRRLSWLARLVEQHEGAKKEIIQQPDPNQLELFPESPQRISSAEPTPRMSGKEFHALLLERDLDVEGAAKWLGLSPEVVASARMAPRVSRKVQNALETVNELVGSDIAS